MTVAGLVGLLAIGTVRDWCYGMQRIGTFLVRWRRCSARTTNSLTAIELQYRIDFLFSEADFSLLACTSKLMAITKHSPNPGSFCPLAANPT
jgi:hypothetical protein